uniref:Leucine-rich repeat-containing protein 34 n=3 Tax=Clastoptera arizonana TaxID=38151 RepID=A0A1B6CWM6_9HEMI
MYMEKVIHFTLNSLFLECMCTRNKDGTKNLVLHGAQLFKRIKRRIINEDISIILNFLKDKPKIKHLYLPYNSITSEGFREIVQFLEENENILTLNIMNNDIDERGIRSLARLRNTMKLTSLRINGNPIGAKGGKYLGFLLLHNNSLRSLDVSQSDQTIESLVYLTAVLQYENNTLEKLNLSRVLGQWYYTLLSDHVAQKLSKMFSTNTSLKEVHLEKLFLTDHDIEILVYGLMYNNTLEVLNLSCNQIGDYGIECLSEYLGKGPPLKKLMIHHNHIGNTGARAFSFKYPSSKIEYLDISENRLTEEGILDILNTLRKPYPIKYLFIRGNKLGFQSRKVIYRMILSGELEEGKIDIKVYKKTKKVDEKYINVFESAVDFPTILSCDGMYALYVDKNELSLPE